MKIYNCVFGAVDSAPYTPRQARDPVSPLGAAAINAGGSILSSALNTIFGAKAQRDANRTNLQIARENNAQAYKMFQEQNAFNLDMWNKQNEYNLPSAQVQRLLAAGINPSSVFGNGSVSEAGSLQSATAPQLQGATMNPYMPDFGLDNAASSGVTAFLQSQMNNAQRKLMESEANKNNADTAHTETLTQWEEKSQFARLRYLEEQAKHQGTVGDMARLSLRFEQDSYWHKLKAVRQDVRMNDQSYQMQEELLYQTRLENGLKEIQLVYQPKMNRAQLRQYNAIIGQIQSVIGLNDANAALSRQEKLTEVKRRTSIILDNAGKILDNNLKRKVFQFSVGMAQEQYSRAFNDNRYFDIGPIRTERHEPFPGPWSYHPENVDKNY